MRQYLPLIQICNPEKLSNEELLQVQTKLYKLPVEELMREKEVLAFLRRVNAEIKIRCQKYSLLKRTGST
jgi:hypothetical protein